MSPMRHHRRPLQAVPAGYPVVCNKWRRPCTTFLLFYTQNGYGVTGTVTDGHRHAVRSDRGIGVNDVTR